jgi:hypothetical protein
MEQIMVWIKQIDVSTLIASLVTFVLGISVVRPKLIKALAIIGDLADLLSVMKSSLADGKLDKIEIESIIKESEELIAEFKAK